MGWAFMNVGRFGDAIDAFSQTLKIDSRNSTVQTGNEPMLKVSMDREALARAYEGAGRTDEAAAEYKLILQTYPDEYIAKRELTRLEKLIHTTNSGNGAKDASKHLDERSIPD
jgi:tetratricopeptide (TPR) repeat protein